MENNVLERIRLIINHYNLSERQIATKIGLTQSAVNVMFKRKSDVKLTTIVNILNSFPEIRIEWLVLGDGEMLRTEGTESRDERYIEHLEQEIEHLRTAQMELIRKIDDKASNEGGKVAV